jgi:hypothetical protein
VRHTETVLASSDTSLADLGRLLRKAGGCVKRRAKTKKRVVCGAAVFGLCGGRRAPGGRRGGRARHPGGQHCRAQARAGGRARRCRARTRRRARRPAVKTCHFQSERETCSDAPASFHALSLSFLSLSCPAAGRAAT